MGWTADVRIAARTLARARFTSALALVALSLGIGITTAVFSIFNGVLLTPLPFRDPERIVVVFGTQPGCPTCPASFPKYHDWKERNQVFSAMGGSTPTSLVMTGRGDATRLDGIATTASLGDVLGVAPLLGRWYTEQEDQPSGPKVVVLSHGFWTTGTGADRNVLGTTLTLNGEPYEVIGIMPPSFTHRRGEVFVPLQRALDPATRGNHFLATYARLKDGVSVEQAAAEMRALGHVLAREFGHNHGIDVRSYTEAVVSGVRTPLTVLLGAVFLVLLIAMANVANLLLAAGLERRRELAIRMALGARVSALARQLTTEGILLAAIGGGIGLLLAQWLVGVFTALAANRLPRADTIHTDLRVVGFAVIVSLAVGVCCGLWPLILLRVKELASAVREGDTRTASGGGRSLRDALVVIEVALAFTLVVGAGVLVKDLMLLRGRDAGIRTERIVAFDLTPSGSQYQSPEQTVALYRELYERISRIDLVDSVGMTSHLPMYSFGYNGEFTIEGASPPDNIARFVEYRWIYGDFLKTVGVPLVKGRMLDGRDGPGTRTVLVNQALADRFWPGQDPIGKRFGQGQDTATWFEIAGVIGNIRSYGLDRDVPFEFYRTLDQSSFTAMTVVIRTRGDDPGAVVPTIRRLVASVDPNLPISRVQTLDQVVADSVGQPRLMSALTGLFGTLAGLLAMVGVYGVMAFNVRRQRREFGIRLALGADTARVQRLVVGRGLALGLMGLVLGAGGAWLLTRALATMLHDVAPTDPAVFAGMTMGVLLTTVAATYLPARSAGRVDPVTVLRDA